MREIKLLLATIMMLVGATTTHAAEDITSNLIINLTSNGYTSEPHFVDHHIKSEYTVKEGVSVTFSGASPKTRTFYLNGTEVKTLVGYTTYTWTAKKDARINFADYGQNKIYLTETATAAVTGVTLSPISGELTAGGAALELTPTVAPEGATDKTVKWSVEQEGSIVALYTDEACTQAVGTAAIAAAKVYVKPLAAGQATITVTTNDGAKTATCTITVLSNKFDLTLKAANVNTIDATQASKGTVSVKEGTGAAVDKTSAITDEGKLTAIKMGSEVKLNAKQGYKFRKVEVKKKSASTPLDNSMTAWTAGTFAVPAGGLTYSDAITVSGDVTLTLTDGETLTLNKGISLASGATLTIQGNGTMNVNGTSGSTASTVDGSGTLVLTSGTLNAKGGNGGGYGEWEAFGATSGSKQAGGVAINGAVTVSGGTLTATGGAGGSIEGYNGNVTAGAGGAAISGSVTLVSGTLTATGGNGGNGGEFSEGTAGAGGAAIGGDLTVNGGTMTTTKGSNGVPGDPTTVILGAGGKAVAGTLTDNR